MIQFNFSPFPELHSERLWLRKLTADDVEAVFRLRSNPQTMQYIPRPLVTDHEGAMAHIQMINDHIDNNACINWAVEMRDSGEFAGIIGFYRPQPENFRAELGYMLLPEHSGKGVATEAVGLALDYGFTVMQLHSVEAVIDPANEGSERVLLKHGFVKEAHFVENLFFNGEFLDSVHYTLLKRNHQVR